MNSSHIACGIAGVTATAAAAAAAPVTFLTAAVALAAVKASNDCEASRTMRRETRYSERDADYSMPQDGREEDGRLADGLAVIRITDEDHFVSADVQMAAATVDF